MNTFSFAALFRGSDAGGLGITAITIPMIQRDYAQGRSDAKARRIRDEFIAALVKAITPDATGVGSPLGLDFVYGQVRGGVFLPLDGQQRLTALFLLHWYLAVRAGEGNAPYLALTYKTRPSASEFCQQLRTVAQENAPLQFGSSCKPSEWITDQPWFMARWRWEPTIASMLVVLDTINEQFGDHDAAEALARLTDCDDPAIVFHVLNLEEMQLGDDIYVRMNSRGKPLTEFEIFKARFGAALETRFPDQAQEFAARIDGEWLDIFWSALRTKDGQPARDGQIDAAIMRYMRFLADYADTRAGEDIAEGESDADTCLRVFGIEADEDRLKWLFAAFDLWTGRDIGSWFQKHFRVAEHMAEGTDTRLPLFDVKKGETNLFLSCCDDYSPDKHKTGFPARLALLLHAILVSRCATDEDTMRRLRMVRNLADWSENELRAKNMSHLIKQTEQIMAGAIPNGTGFNTVQWEDERRKAEAIAQRPDLEPIIQKLEDHDLLRGRLVAFDLDAAVLPNHAEAFARVFDDAMDYGTIAAALLAADNYTDRGYSVRCFVPAKRHPLRWRAVLTTTNRGTTTAFVTDALKSVLDCVVAGGQDPYQSLEQGLIQPFLQLRSSNAWFDWRYYFVKYSAMRQSNQGCYSPVKVNGQFPMGYVVRRHANVAWSNGDTDPFLDAVREALGDSLAAHVTPEQAANMDSGQWLRLTPSGITIASGHEGWRIYVPNGQADGADIQSVFERFGITPAEIANGDDGADLGNIWHFPICQTDTVPNGIIAPNEREVPSVDTENRVARIAEFVSALLGVNRSEIVSANIEQRAFGDSVGVSLAQTE